MSGPDTSIRPHPEGPSLPPDGHPGCECITCWPLRKRWRAKSDPYAKACVTCGHLPRFHKDGRCTLDAFCDGYLPPSVGRFHFSRFAICPLTWFLDRIGRCSTADDIDTWASDRGWWSRG